MRFNPTSLTKSVEFTNFVNRGDFTAEAHLQMLVRAANEMRTFNFHETAEFIVNTVYPAIAKGEGLDEQFPRQNEHLDPEFQFHRFNDEQQEENQSDEWFHHHEKRFYPQCQVTRHHVSEEGVEEFLKDFEDVTDFVTTTSKRDAMMMLLDQTSGADEEKRITILKKLVR